MKKIIQNIFRKNSAKIQHRSRLLEGTKCEKFSKISEKIQKKFRKKTKKISKQ